MARALRVCLCLLVSATLVLDAGDVPVSAASCTPLKSGVCRACKNCHACGHCARGGGKCSVCARAKGETSHGASGGGMVPHIVAR
jgi:hypothetical protein